MIAERVLEIVVKGLELWERGRGLDEILEDLFRGTDTNLRSKVSAVLFTYFRNKGFIDHVMGLFVNKKMEPVVRRIISVALVQIFYQDRIAKEVAVDVAVNFSRKQKSRKTAGFVNAVLRNAIRSMPIQPPPKCNISGLLLKRWEESFSSSSLKRIIEAIEKQPASTFRLLGNANEDALKDYTQEYPYFGNHSVPSRAKQKQVSPSGTKNGSCPECTCSKIGQPSWCNKFKFYQTDKLDLILKTDLFSDGKIYIQDPATALAPSLIEKNITGKILDACAAPGGKTIMLSELFPESEIVAMDRSAKRLEQLTENIIRTKRKNITPLLGDALIPSFDSESFDIVLADVPCTNTGVIRRRPDVMWHFTQERLEEILQLQADILSSLSKLVKPGGILVYSTCSIEDDENRRQIDRFLKNNALFGLAKEQLLLPSKNNDGAYAAIINLSYG